MDTPNPTKLQISNNLKSSDFDAIVVIAPDVEKITQESVKNPLKNYISVDKSGQKGVFVVPCDLPCKKIVFSGVGEIENDFNDVRIYAKVRKN